MINNISKVAAIVVTYNRINLLQNCIKAIRNQSYKNFDIIVVNNGSTDGTEQWLVNQPDIKTITQANLGGAGGFHNGLKYAYERGYDYFWIMDDDGVPANDCLEKLLDFAKFDFVAPLVLDINCHDKVAFPYLSEKTLDEIENKYGKNGIINDYANPFNGILVSLKLVQTIGLPMKDMFIWGDEIEYQTRAKFYGFIPKTIIRAIHYHPADRMVRYKDFLGNKRLVYVESILKRYCKYRNEAYCIKKYATTKGKYYFYLSYIAFYIINRKFDISGLKLFLKATYDGRHEIFTEHNKYIQ